MDFLKSCPRFDFLYGDIPFSQLAHGFSHTESANMLTTVYSFADGL